MKKLILSGTVIVLFVGYSLGLRHDETKKVSAQLAPSTPSTVVNNSDTGSDIQSATSASTTTYKDGTYTGSVADAFYGNIQVEATISGGKITDVRFLKYPNDRRESIEINQQAMPMLKQESLQAQRARVDGVSGATDTSHAFVQSLTVALNKAV